MLVACTTTIAGDPETLTTFSIFLHLLNFTKKQFHPYAGPFAQTFRLPTNFNALHHQLNLAHNLSLQMRSMEAYLLLEVARSDHQISLKWKDLAYEIVHHNTITLQLNHIFLEQVERDLHMVDEHVGHICLTIRQSGHSAAPVYAMRESWPHGSEARDQSTNYQEVSEKVVCFVAVDLRFTLYPHPVPASPLPDLRWGIPCEVTLGPQSQALSFQMHTMMVQLCNFSQEKHNNEAVIECSDVANVFLSPSIFNSTMALSHIKSGMLATLISVQVTPLPDPWTYLGRRPGASHLTRVAETSQQIVGQDTSVVHIQKYKDEAKV
ncbi:hypothetical protein EDC04DRAFT_2610071 [Pisolithus marmoratus]|nr:hypothetical protein EDC04DRAFT_2610071 [Pisolithus marmoratus]